MSPSPKRQGAGVWATIGKLVTVFVRLLVLNPTGVGAMCTATHPNPASSLFHSYSSSTLHEDPGTATCTFWARDFGSRRSGPSDLVL
jgi:hypothetical protein